MSVYQTLITRLSDSLTFIFPPVNPKPEETTPEQKGRIRLCLHLSLSVCLSLVVCFGLSNCLSVKPALPVCLSILSHCHTMSLSVNPKPEETIQGDLIFFSLYLFLYHSQTISKQMAQIYVFLYLLSNCLSASVCLSRSVTGCLSFCPLHCLSTTNHS